VFTGIVQEIGEIRRSESRSGSSAGSDRRIEVAYATLARERLELGASVAVDGVCLTVAAHGPGSFFADVSGETLAVTTLGAKQDGARVNLELSLRAGDSLGGHWVSGHVDGLAEVLSTGADARSLRVELAAPATLARYIARKGSVTLDGVSLTVNEVAGANFTINLIPHTLEVTTLARLAPGVRLNLEIDVMARYVERISSFSGTNS
jgi:riboflavin synthase